MPPRRRRPHRLRPLRAFPGNDVGGAAVENALILSLTAVMIYSVKTTSGVVTLFKPMQQAFATLVRALS